MAGRPRIDQTIQKEIVTLRAEGMSLDQVWEKVRDPVTERPDRRTVARYFRQYDLLPDSVKRWDRPYEWHLTGEIDLPWEAGEWLLEMCYITEMTLADHLMTRPTCRQVKWWWRLQKACPEISKDKPMEVGRASGKLDLILLAERFVTRELLHDVVTPDEPLDLRGLDAFLVYKPWVDENRHKNYHKAIENGTPPYKPLTDFQKQRIDILKTPAGVKIKATRPVLAAIAEEVEPECPELLFSQQKERRDRQMSKVDRTAAGQQFLGISYQPGPSFGAAVTVPSKGKADRVEKQSPNPADADAQAGRKELK
jgi:hypothetical protein